MSTCSGEEGSEFYIFYGNEDMPLPTCTEHT